MSATPRDFTVTYGGFVIGTGTTRQITGVSKTEIGYERAVLEFDFIIRATTPALFATEIAAVEAAFRTPYQNLTVVVGDTQTAGTWCSFSQGSATGFDIQPELSKSGDPVDTGLSRKYHVRFTIRLPANLLGGTAGRMGRQSSTVNVSYAPNRRRTITISGVYTGVPSGSSVLGRNQYEAQIGAYVNAVLLSIDSAAVFELVGEPITEVDDTVDTSVGRGKVIRFQRVYEEILYKQAGFSVSGLDNPDIVQQRLAITRRYSGQEFHPEVTQLAVCDVSYEAWFDRVSLGGLDNALKYNWDTKIRDFIMAEVKRFMFSPGGGGFAVVEENPQIDYDNFRISATMVVEGQMGGGPYEATLTVTDSIDTGTTLIPVWGGSPYARLSYQGPIKRERTITRTALVGTKDQLTGDPVDLASLPKFAKGQIISAKRSSSPVRHGLFDKDNFLLWRTTEEIVIQYFVGANASRTQKAGDSLDNVPGYGTRSNAAPG
jgi:hypothetical protein